MLKFIKHHMSSIEGIEIYPMISLLIFFLFFTALFYWVISSKKEYLNRVSQIPFDKDHSQNTKNNIYEN